MIETNLILASASPRRAAILRDAGFAFTVAPSGVVEPEPECGRPEELAVQLAKSKAMAVARKERGAVVIGADTVVALDGRLLAKPADAPDAARMLRMLRGRSHEVITGVAVARAATRGAAGRSPDRRPAANDGPFLYTGHRSSSVMMRSYRDGEIAAYVASGLPMDKAGGYGIQDRPFSPARQVVGCYLNVVGLPLCLLGELLAAAGVGSPGGDGLVCDRCGHQAAVAAR